MVDASSVRQGEADLVALAAQGDERAFRRLVTPHREMAFAVCFRITGSRHDAEDALQNALLAAWRNLGSFQGRSRFSTWLYQIAHNAALAVVRKRVPEPTDAPIQLVSSLGRPESVDEVDAVQRALAKLPPQFRAALVLRECCDLTYQDIAEAQGVELATVKSRISRARQAMAALLADSEGLGSGA